jgi:hypothetical protein
MITCFHLSYRQTEGIVRAHAGKETLFIPDHNTINRRVNRPHVKIKEKK